MSRLATEAFHRDGSVFKIYMDAIEGVTEAPNRFHYGAMLGILGAAIGRHVVLNYGPHKLYPITPVVLVGPSGIGKGESMGIARTVLKKLKSVTKTWTDNKGEHSADSTSIWILQDEATPSALVKCYTMYPWGESVSPESNAPEIAIMAGEMATFMAKTGEKEGMVPIMTKLLEQDDSYVRTLVKDLSRGEHQHIKNPTLSFIAGTTVDWMKKMMPSEMFAGGFFRRCIMIVESKKGRSLEWPVHLNAEAIKDLSAAWKEILEPYMKLSGEGLKRKAHVMNMDACRDYWIKFKRRHDSNVPEDPRLIGHYNSHPQHVLRTAMTFALSQGRLNMTPDDLRYAEAWIQSLIPDVMQILLQGETFGFAENCQLLERIMMDRGRIKKEELWKLIRLPERQFNEVVDWGKSTGLIQTHEADRTNGETGTYYKLVGKGRNTWGNKRGRN